MKKLITALILIAIIVLSFCAFGVMPVDETPADANNTVVMFSKDGRSVEVPKDEVEEYKSVDWYENFSDVITTMWAQDGRSMIVYKDNVKTYKDVGWYENRSDVISKLYKGDGDNVEEKEVFKAEVDQYLAEGWKRTKGNVDPDKPMVAFTFDDGPDAKLTNRVLDAFEQHGGRGTFFMLGDHVGRSPEAIRRMKDLGCEIGSHTYDHTQLTKLSAEGVKDQVEKTNQKINEACGQNPTVMRPPYGSYNDTVKASAGMPIILWSIDTLDWKSKNADTIYNSTMASLHDGDIILIHDIHEFSVDAAVRLIPAIQQAGYQLVTVSEMAAAKGADYQAGKVYTDFRPGSKGR